MEYRIQIDAGARVKKTKRIRICSTKHPSVRCLLRNSLCFAFEAKTYSIYGRHGIFPCTWLLVIVGECHVRMRRATSVLCLHGVPVCMEARRTYALRLYAFCVRKKCKRKDVIETWKLEGNESFFLRCYDSHVRCDPSQYRSNYGLGAYSIPIC